jgi:F-type H+-transporting ATPase subunit epsilon
LSSEQPLAVLKTTERLTARILAPYRTLYEGPAISVSAANRVGPFDVLPRHTSFLSLLMPCTLVVRLDNNELKYEITRGIILVAGNTVTVFTKI